MIKGVNDQKCGLLGEKLGHSFSPQIHACLADYSYSLFEMPEDKVADFLRSDKFDSINVTIPYKKTVMPYLDEISEQAKAIGSVNTVTHLPDGRLRGDNTDYYGFLYLVRKSGIEVKGKKVLILGTGGSSLTLHAVCKDLGAKKILFVSRSGEINYDNVYSLHADADVIVNSTPVGMYPKNGKAPVDLERFKSCRGVLDIIFNPAKTQLLLDAERLNIPCANGLPMLVAQAKRASEIFLGKEIVDGEIDRITKIIESQTLNIVLVGMPGCGKSTVGRILSEMTGRKLIDTDEYIEQSSGKRIPDIINGSGEAVFRALEHEAAAEIGKMSGGVISTGGGIVTRDENYAPLVQNGIVFFIHRPLESLPIEGRPLSQKAKLSEMYEKRLPMYRSFCHFEVDNNGRPDECARKILELFERKENK